MTTSLWFDNWHPYSPLSDSYGERFIYDSGMKKNARVNVLINNLEWRIPTTHAIGRHPIVEAIPSKSNPKIWLDSPNQRFSVKVAWEQLWIHNQMVEWHDIVWFKNVFPRQSFLLWVAVQQKLTTQDRLHRFGIHGPNRCSLCLRNNEDHNHLLLARLSSQFCFACFLFFIASWVIYLECAAKLVLFGVGFSFARTARR